MKKVLLTSSSTLFLERNMHLLTDKGFQFCTAATGREALELHQQHLFDLILSDLELEDMDGCILCSEVRKVNSSHHVPLVLICYDTHERMERVRQSGATAVLLKPINPSQLLVTIGSFIDMQLARSKRVAFKSKVLSQLQSLKFFSISHDISATGLLLETEQQLSLGVRVSFEFNLSDSCLIKTEGEVARCITAQKGNNLYGIKFIDLPLPKRSVIEKYVVSNDHLGIKQKPIHLLGKALY